MADSFGARLRRRREEQQIALAQIAADTKIKESLLEALERDDVSRWPNGIFRRAYIRSYAKAIGLQPDAVAQEFNERFPDTDQEFAAAAEIAPDDASSSGRRRSLRGFMQAAFGARPEASRPNPLPQPPSQAADRPPRNWDELVSRPLSAPAHASTVEPSDDAWAEQHVRREADNAEPISSEALTADALTVEAVAPSLLAEPLPAAAPLSDTLFSEDTPAEEPVAEARFHEEPASTVDVAPAFQPNLTAAARVCAAVARSTSAGELEPLLAEMTNIIGATGLIIWTWNSQANDLRAVAGYGYPRRVMRMLPAVAVDDDNATATAFRSGELCAVGGGSEANAAIVAPIVSARGSVGAFAVELPPQQQNEAVCALVTVFAAQLAAVLDGEVAALARRFA